MAAASGLPLASTRVVLERNVSTSLDAGLLTVNIAGDEMGPANAVDFTFEKVPKLRGTRVEAKLSEKKPGAHVRWARDCREVVQALSASIRKK